jgi:hypothetical protein
VLRSSVPSGLLPLDVVALNENSTSAALAVTGAVAVSHRVVAAAKSTVDAQAEQRRQVTVFGCVMAFLISVVAGIARLADIAQAEAEQVIQPHGVANDRTREPVALISDDEAHSHPPPFLRPVHR